MRSARAVRLASATTTSGTYSTPNISRTVCAIRHACRVTTVDRDQNRKSSGSPSLSPVSSAVPLILCFVEPGINDASPSRHGSRPNTVDGPETDGDLQLTHRAVRAAFKFHAYLSVFVAWRGCISTLFLSSERRANANLISPPMIVHSHDTAATDALD